MTFSPPPGARSGGFPSPWSLLVTLLLAQPANAYDGQLYLNWDDCALDGAGGTGYLSGCQTDEGSVPLYAAFKLAQPVDERGISRAGRGALEKEY